MKDWHTKEPEDRELRDVQLRIQFRPVFFADIVPDEGGEWLVNDIIPLSGLIVIYGESGSGKTFLACDMGLAVARGRPWGGKNVQAGLVIYIAAEGVSGFRKRVAAYRERHKVPPDTPFLMINGAPDFGTKPGDVVQLIAPSSGQSRKLRYD
jgi:AAA domain